MSPWFSGGWIALELANSREVKVVFRGSCGLPIKELDEEILAPEHTGRPPANRYEKGSAIIRNLRKEITILNNILIVLGPRYISWPKDVVVIAGLLARVEVIAKDPKQDVWQQDIYGSILKIGKVSPRHLFHNSPTVSNGFSWYQINLFNMPVVNASPFLQVRKWKVTQVTDIPKRNFNLHGTHHLIKAEIQLALENLDKREHF